MGAQEGAARAVKDLFRACWFKAGYALLYPTGWDLKRPHLGVLTAGRGDLDHFGRHVRQAPARPVGLRPQTLKGVTGVEAIPAYQIPWPAQRPPGRRGRLAFDRRVRLAPRSA